ncbi:MAG: hypothetical protein KDK25_06035 [Leptospiraceae bacterium]|nr:hypothetical protein [Leptospiraceae bacterium]
MGILTPTMDENLCASALFLSLTLIWIKARGCSTEYCFAHGLKEFEEFKGIRELKGRRYLG